MRKLLLILFVPFLLNGQAKIGKNHSLQNLNCKTCHSCDIPTKENPCLISCPRGNMVRIDQKPEEGPRILTINKIRETDLYEHSIFSHLAHAEMAEMSGGCQMCHHYNPPGNVVPCSDCHEATRQRTDLSKPDLKGAYHQQCMNCHRAWSGKTECASCHLPKGQKSPSTVKAKDATKSRIHPEIVTPQIITYNTVTPKGKLVTFYHNDHTSLFGFECADCHKNEGCVKCHSVVKTEPAKKKPLIELHKKCSNCHNTESNNQCNKCHSDSERGRFNHKISTGFDLSKFHSKLTCIRCHTTKTKFTGLKNECSSCHGSWSSDNFDHKITGLILDELHGGFECSDCHKEPTFSKPDCSDCHDDLSYPKDKPGKLVRR